MTASAANSNPKPANVPNAKPALPINSEIERLLNISSSSSGGTNT